MFKKVNYQTLILEILFGQSSNLVQKGNFCQKILISKRGQREKDKRHTIERINYHHRTYLCLNTIKSTIPKQEYMHEHN